MPEPEAEVQAEDDAEPKPRQPLRSRDVLQQLAPLYLTCLLSRLTRGLVVVTLPLYVLDLGGTAADVGFLSSLYGIGFMAANVPGGFLLPLIGSKCCLLVACTAGPAFGWYLLRNKFGRAHATYIANSVSKETGKRGFALSIMGGLQRLSLMLGPSLGAVLQGQLHIQAVFIAQLACAGLAALVTAAFLRNAKAESEASTKKSTGFFQARDAMRENGGRLVRVLGFAAALQCVRKGRELFFSLAGREAKLSDMVIGQVAALSFLVDTLASPVAGRLMDSWGRRSAGVASLTLQSLGLLLLAFQNTPAVVASAVLTGLGNGLGSGLLMTLGADLAPGGPGQGAFIAVYRLLFTGLDFITPALLGILTTASSLEVAELTTGAIGLLGVVWLLLCVPETLQTPAAGKSSTESSSSCSNSCSSCSSSSSTDTTKQEASGQQV
eukprot:s1823_g13.t1